MWKCPKCGKQIELALIRTEKSKTFRPYYTGRFTCPNCEYERDLQDLLDRDKPKDEKSHLAMVDRIREDLQQIKQPWYCDDSPTSNDSAVRRSYIFYRHIETAAEALRLALAHYGKKG